jgi:hypothetical protein
MLTPMMNGIQSEPASKAVYMSHLSSGVMEQLLVGSQSEPAAPKLQQDIADRVDKGGGALLRSME